MRNYLYIWHNPEEQYIFASGIEFSDISNNLDEISGVILIKHESCTALTDTNSNFDYMPSRYIDELNSEDIYSWGDVVWLNYNGIEALEITEQEIAELLYFSHRLKPLNKVSLGSLNNDFLVTQHDDGWRLKLYYQEWSYISKLLSNIVPSSMGQLNLSKLKEGTNGVWLSEGETVLVEKTIDINRIIDKCAKLT